MRSSRFYFADAAATGYFEHLLDREQVKDFLSTLADTVGQVNQTLRRIVEAYIQRRGYSFRTEAER